MSFTFICPNCRQKLEAEEEWLGMEAECPGCGKKIIVQKTVVLKKANESDGMEATSKGNDGHNQSDVKGIVRQLYTEFHTANDGMFKGAEVSASKENNLRKTAQIPQDVKILLLIDNTVFGSAKNGMALTESGIYLHNDWAGKTSGSFFVSWKEFVKNGKECLKLASSNEVQIAPEIYLDTAGGGMGAKRIHKFLCRLYEQMADQGTVLSSNESAPIPEMKTPEVAKESSSSEAAATSSMPNLCGQPQPQSRYHLSPSPMEEKTEAASPSQGLPPSEPSEPSKSEAPPASPEGATNNKESKKKDDGCGGMVVLLVIIGIVAWLGWLGLSHWPRLSFWLLAPVTGVVVLAYSGKLPKLVTALLCAGIVFWGWKAHTADRSSSSGHQRTVQLEITNERCGKLQISCEAHTVPYSLFIFPYSADTVNIFHRWMSLNEKYDKLNKRMESLGNSATYKDASELLNVIGELKRIIIEFDNRWQGSCVYREEDMNESLSAPLTIKNIPEGKYLIYFVSIPGGGWQYKDYALLTAEIKKGKTAKVRFGFKQDNLFRFRND